MQKELPQQSQQASTWIWMKKEVVVDQTKI